MSVKLVLEPSVYLVGRQQVVSSELERFLVDGGFKDWTTDTDVPAEVLVEVAGRNCYQSFKASRPGGNAAYIKHLLEVSHGSVLEHANWSFIITGVSRSLANELVRHRHFSFSQLSQRYVDESNVAFVVPPALMNEVSAAEMLRSRFGDPIPKARDVLDWGNRHLDVDGVHQLTAAEGAGLRWIAAAEQDQADYLFLSDYLSSSEKFPEITDRTERRKAAREAARSVLGNDAETKIFVTANARALRNFLELRGSRHADAEIRRLAFLLLEGFRSEAPNIFSDYQVVTLPDGRQEITTEYRKV